MNRSSLNYLFENTLGRIILLLFIVNLTIFNSTVGYLTSFIIIGLYNYDGIEGFETQGKEDSNISTINENTSSSVSSVPTPLTATTTSSTNPTNVSSNTSMSSNTEDLTNTNSSPIPENSPSPPPDTNKVEEKKPDEEKSKDAFGNIKSYLSPAPFGVERNILLTNENNIRPKDSKYVINKSFDKPFLPINSEGEFEIYKTIGWNYL